MAREIRLPLPHSLSLLPRPAQRHARNPARIDYQIGSWAKPPISRTSEAGSGAFLFQIPRGSLDPFSMTANPDPLTQEMMLPGLAPPLPGAAAQPWEHGACLDPSLRVPRLCDGAKHGPGISRWEAKSPGPGPVV